MDGAENAPFNPLGITRAMDIPRFPADPSDIQGKKSCCAALYQSDAVRLLLGDTLHPGGLALTHRLGKVAGIQRNNMVLDVACGWGTSAVALARSFHCRVMGVELGREAVAEATRHAKDSGVDGLVSFLCGDGEELPLRQEFFDVAVCECSMSLFPDKSRGVAEMARLLRTGGRLGVSDVTVEPGCLPDELTGPLGQMLCLTSAPPVDGYRELLDSNGLALAAEQDASDSVQKLLAEIEGKLATFHMLQKLQDQSEDGPDLISQALATIDKVKALVKEGSIGN